MSNKNTYYKIGLLTIVGFVLFSIMIVVLGAGSIFRISISVETYFDESVQGLSIGAPVKYRGVTIGDVKEIGFCNKYYRFDINNEDHKRYHRYVYIKMSLYPTTIGAPVMDMSRTLEEKVEDIVGDGMRFRLASQGITGLTYIEADFLDPEENPSLEFHWEPREVYIPSAKSTIARLSDSIVNTLENIQKINFEKISNDLDKLLLSADKLFLTVDKSIQDIKVPKLREDMSSLVRNTDSVVLEVESFAKRINEFLAKPELNSIPGDVSLAISDTRKVISDFRKVTEQLAPITQDLSQKLGESLDQYTKLAKDLDVIVQQEEIQETIRQSPQIAKQITQTLKRVQTIIVNNQHNINATLSNLKNISNNLKQLSSDAKKFPAQVLFGEPPKKN